MSARVFIVVKPTTVVTMSVGSLPNNCADFAY